MRGEDDGSSSNHSYLIFISNLNKSCPRALELCNARIHISLDEATTSAVLGAAPLPWPLLSRNPEYINREYLDGDQ